jgi:hypothetical protein
MNADNLRKELRHVVTKYLDTNVNAPAFETIEKDFHAQDKLADILILLRVTVDCIQKQGLSFDKDYLRQLSKPEIEKRIDILERFGQTGHLSQETKEILKSGSSRKDLLAYLVRELNWVVTSILSASYLSANIIMRSIFDLLIGIATKKRGSMSERINAIPFLSPEEKKESKKLWDDFCAWVHPYTKWTREICPIFISCRPMYHSKLCKQSLEKFEKLVDLLLVIALEKFEIDKKDILSKVKNYRIDTSNFVFFHDRC